jgi:hypothetical protein
MSANADRGELENQLNSSCHYDGGQNQLKVSNPYNLKNKEFLNFIDPNSHQDDIKNKIILSNISNTKIPCIYYYIKRCV